MATLRNLSRQHPLAFAVLLTVATFVVGAVGLLIRQISPWLQANPLISAGDALLTLFAVVLLTGLGWWGAAGFNPPTQWRALQVLWLPTLIALLPLAGLLAGYIPVPSVATMAAAALTFFLVGFQEEAFYRGIVLHALLPKGRLRAVMVSALLFGLTHVFGLLIGRHVSLVLVQVIGAFGAGVMAGAIRLRTGTIWPLIITHALFDFLGSLAAPQQGSLVIQEAPPIGVLIYLSVLGLIYFGYGLFLLRREWLPGTRAKRTEPQAVP